MASATSTLATVMTAVTNTVVDLATTVITTYWPYLLVFSLIAAMIGAFAKFSHVGVRKG